MSWYKQSMARVWGQMASGIMFRYNGKVLLQSRSQYVEDPGQWGIPGGAMKGTEGFYESTELPFPILDDSVLEDLWNSAMIEVEEELSFVPDVSEEQKINSINNRIENFKDNFAYVTFPIDLNDEQK